MKEGITIRDQNGEYVTTISTNEIIDFIMDASNYYIDKIQPKNKPIFSVDWSDGTISSSTIGCYYNWPNYVTLDPSLALGKGVYEQLEPNLGVIENAKYWLIMDIVKSIYHFNIKVLLDDKMKRVGRAKREYYIETVELQHTLPHLTEQDITKFGLRPLPTFGIPQHKDPAKDITNSSLIHHFIVEAYNKSVGHKQYTKDLKLFKNNKTNSFGIIVEYQDADRKPRQLTYMKDGKVNCSKETFNNFIYRNCYMAYGSGNTGNKYMNNISDCYIDSSNNFLHIVMK